MFKRILVLGGSGFVGQSVCERLVRRATTHAALGGSAPRVVVPTRRAPSARTVQALPALEVVQADVHDDAALLRLVAQSDAVIHLVAQLHGNDASFQRTHVELPTRLAHACAKTGVRRVVHLSALGVDEPTSRYARSKAAGEAVLLQHPALDLTVLRPSVIFGAHDRFTNLFASLQQALPLMPLASAQSQFQPVWVDDVAQAAVQALDWPATALSTQADKIVECGGPQVMSLADIVRLVGRVAGCARPVLPVPSAIARLQALAMELLPGDPLLSRDNLDSMRNPNVLSGRHASLVALGIQPASMAQVLPTYLGHDQVASRLDAWRAVAGRH